MNFRRTKNFPLAIANMILEKSFKDNIDINPMKLQRLIYLIYKEYLKLTKKRLFNEKFSVWKYGPVLLSIYKKFDRYGSNHIDDFYYNNIFHLDYLILTPNYKLEYCLNKVWEKYSKFSATYLSNMINQKKISI